MLYILYGPDEFSIMQDLRRIKDGLDDREALASNTNVFEGKGVGLSQLMDTCMALPFLGSHRLVIVEGLLARFSRGSEGAADLKQWKALGDWVLPPTTALVLIDGDIKKTNALLKALSPAAEVREFLSLKGAVLARWIEGRVREGGGTISAGAVRMLASLVGDNLWVLASEIEKVLLYAEGRRIDEMEVKDVVSYVREANVFAMVDALIEGQAARAAPLLHRLLDEGATAPYLLVMVTRQLRLLVQAKELSMRGVRPAEAKRRLGVASDFVLNKALEQARLYSMERLEWVYRKLLETDLAIKRGVWKGDMALDLLVAELCG